MHHLKSLVFLLKLPESVFFSFFGTWILQEFHFLLQSSTKKPQYNKKQRKQTVTENVCGTPQIWVHIPLEMLVHHFLNFWLKLSENASPRPLKLVRALTHVYTWSQTLERALLEVTVLLPQGQYQTGILCNNVSVFTHKFLNKQRQGTSCYSGTTHFKSFWNSLSWSVANHAKEAIGLTPQAHCCHQCWPWLDSAHRTRHRMDYQISDSWDKSLTLSSL